MELYGFLDNVKKFCIDNYGVKVGMDTPLSQLEGGHIEDRKLFVSKLLKAFPTGETESELFWRSHGSGGLNTVGDVVKLMVSARMYEVSAEWRQKRSYLQRELCSIYFCGDEKGGFACFHIENTAGNISEPPTSPDWRLMAHCLDGHIIKWFTDRFYEIHVLNKEKADCVDSFECIKELSDFIRVNRFDEICEKGMYLNSYKVKGMTYNKDDENAFKGIIKDT